MAQQFFAPCAYALQAGSGSTRLPAWLGSFLLYVTVLPYLLSAYTCPCPLTYPPVCATDGLPADDYTPRIVGVVLQPEHATQVLLANFPCMISCCSWRSAACAAGDGVCAVLPPFWACGLSMCCLRCVCPLHLRLGSGVGCAYVGCAGVRCCSGRARSAARRGGLFPHLYVWLPFFCTILLCRLLAFFSRC